MVVIENPGTHREDRILLSWLLKEELLQMGAQRQAEFLAELIELLTEKGMISPREVGNLVYRTLGPDTEEGED